MSRTNGFDSSDSSLPSDSARGADSAVPAEARQLAKLTRRYLLTRNMGFLIAMLIIVPLCIVGMGLSILLGLAIHSGHVPLVWMASIGEALWMAAVIYFSVPPWGGRLIERLTARYYRQEGTAEIAGAAAKRRPKWVARVVAGGFGLCILLSVLLGFLGFLPPEAEGKYMQPIAALYCVPFLVFLWWWQYPRKSVISLLWPALFAVHAILVVSGAPIVFTGRYEGWNMYLPCFGYGLLTAVAGHIYNRLALRRLQRAAREGL